MTEHLDILAKELKWPKGKLAATIALIDEGNTIPFIARYRKEVTGEMDETVLRTLVDRLNYLRNLAKRKEEILQSIDEQGKLTDELRAQIMAANVLQEVEDLYLPYRQKRKTRASLAKEKGLEPLALAIMEASDRTLPEVLAKAYLNTELGVETVNDALNGAMDIIAEIIADDADIRKICRNLTWKNGRIVSKAVDE